MKNITSSSASVLTFVIKYKYMLIAIVGGALLLILPRVSTGQARDAPTSAELASYSIGTNAATDEIKLSEVLSRLEGVGTVSVALSETGAVIVCPNINSELKLNITQAVSAYTGLSTEKIIILKGAKR